MSIPAKVFLTCLIVYWVCLKLSDGFDSLNEPTPLVIELSSIGSVIVGFITAVSWVWMQ